MNTVKAYRTCNGPTYTHETIYFVDDNGDVYTSGIRNVSSYFNPQGQKWTLANDTPMIDCTFIGNYRNPLTNGGYV